MSRYATPAPIHAAATRAAAVVNLTTTGRIFFGTAVVASGIQQIVLAKFVRLVPELPTWIPWHPFWACFVGAVLIAVGAEILVGKRLRIPAMVLGALLLLCLFFLYLPAAGANPLVGYMWTNPCKVLALCGGVLVLAGMGSTKTRNELAHGGPRSAKWEGLGRVLLALFLLVGGVQHFIYVDFVKTLVPIYMPGPAFWAYFTGLALVLGGTGLLLPKTARLAALSCGIMILLWVVMLHIPLALADVRKAGETSAIFEALAISGVAFLVAGTVRKPVAD